MSKTFKIISLLFVTLLGLSACSKDTMLDEGVGGKGNTITFTLQDAATPAVRATAAGAPTIVETPALDREKRISEIYAVLFSNGQWFKTVKATGTGTYTVAADVEGTFDMYLVANPDAALVTKLQNNVTTVVSYEQLVATQSAGEDNTATNFLMTSAKKTVTTTPLTTTNIGAIKLVRLAARYDFYNRVPKLNITKITMKNRFVESRIARGALNERMDGLTSNSTKTYEAAQGLTSYDCIAAMYSYENMYPGGTSLVIEGQYDGIDIHPTEILLENLPIKRNHLYTIILTPKDENGGFTPFTPDNLFGSVNLDVVVKDWEEAETIEWTGAKAAGSILPNFTATATANLTEQGNENPTTLTVTNAAANSVTLTVKGVSAGSKLVHTEGAMPTGYNVTTGALTVIDRVPTQTFTIALPQNTTYTKELPFELQNALDPTVKRNVTLKHQGVRAKLPIEYVADYNVAADGMNFVASHNNNEAGGYFSFADATSKFAAITIDGKAYHLPSRSELLAITAAQTGTIKFNAATTVNGVSEIVTVKGVSATYEADYKGTAGKVSYAVKFKGNGDTYKCAYRYELVGTVAAGSNDSRLKVTVRYLGTSNKGIAEVADPSFWATDNSGDIVKYFSAFGFFDGDNIVKGVGTSGIYMSSDLSNGVDRHYAINFGPSQMYIPAGYSTTTKLAVRLFSDK